MRGQRQRDQQHHAGQHGGHEPAADPHEVRRVAGVPGVEREQADGRHRDQPAGQPPSGAARRRRPRPRSSSSPVQVKNQDSRCRLSSSYDRVSRDAVVEEVRPNSGRSDAEREERSVPPTATSPSRAGTGSCSTSASTRLDHPGQRPAQHQRADEADAEQPSIVVQASGCRCRPCTAPAGPYACHSPYGRITASPAANQPARASHRRSTHSAASPAAAEQHQQHAVRPAQVADADQQAGHQRRPPPPGLHGEQHAEQRAEEQHLGQDLGGRVLRLPDLHHVRGHQQPGGPGGDHAGDPAGDQHGRARRRDARAAAWWRRSRRSRRRRTRSPAAPATGGRTAGRSPRRPRRRSRSPGSGRPGRPAAPAGRRPRAAGRRSRSSRPRAMAKACMT